MGNADMQERMGLIRRGSMYGIGSVQGMALTVSIKNLPTFPYLSENRFL